MRQLHLFFTCCCLMMAIFKNTYAQRYQESLSNYGHTSGSVIKNFTSGHKYGGYANGGTTGYVVRVTYTFTEPCDVPENPWAIIGSSSGTIYYWYSAPGVLCDVFYYWQNFDPSAPGGATGESQEFADFPITDTSNAAINIHYCDKTTTLLGGDYDAVATQFDFNGNVQYSDFLGTCCWEQPYYGVHYTWPYYITPTADGNFIMAVNNYCITNVRTLVMKITPTHDILWHNVIDNYLMPIELVTQVIEQKHTHNIILLNNISGTEHRVNILDPSGNPLDARQFIETNSVSLADIYCMTQDPNGDLYFAAMLLTQNKDLPRELVLFKTNRSASDVLWAKKIEVLGTTFLEGFSLQFVPEVQQIALAGRYYVSGGDYHAFYTTLDTLGSTQSVITFNSGCSGSQTTGRDVKYDPVIGSFWLSGVTNCNSGSSDIDFFLIKGPGSMSDGIANPGWTYENTGEDMLIDMFAINTGGFLLHGYQWASGFDRLLVQTDVQGRTTSCIMHKFLPEIDVDNYEFNPVSLWSDQIPISDFDLPTHKTDHIPLVIPGTCPDCKCDPTLVQD